MMLYNLFIWLAEDLLRADKSAGSAINRLLLLCQASSVAWEQGDRKGRPYISCIKLRLTQHYGSMGDSVKRYH
jgi:hypothetical protein